MHPPPEFAAEVREGGCAMTELKHLVDTALVPKEELVGMLEVIGLLKEATEKGLSLPLLEGMGIAMLFDQHSTRTRVSFEAAMNQLGGYALYLPTQTLHMGSGMETVKDTAHVVSSMVDGIVIRADRQTVIEEMARWSNVPLISGMSADGLHPVQAISDLFTIMEHLPHGKQLEDVVFMLIGDTSDQNEIMDCVFRSLMRLLPRFGITVVACSPEGYTPSDEYAQWVNETMAEAGGKLIVTHDPCEYIAEADFIYTGAYVYYEDGHTKEAAERLFLPKYQVNDDLLRRALSHCKVMHYMPGYRGMEITDEVWDGPHSLLLPEAENRLHTARGLLAWYLYPHKKHAERHLFDRYMGRAEEALTKRVPRYES